MSVGAAVGASDGEPDGASVGASDGVQVGAAVGASHGLGMGCGLGNLFVISDHELNSAIIFLRQNHEL